MTLLIRGGTVVNHDHRARADVLVVDGKVVQVAKDISVPTGATTLDASGAFVIPGGIDPHTHLEFPFMGTVSVDDFEWGTRAALAGGTTTVIDHCIPGAGQSMAAAYQDWRRKSERALCDYGFHMAVVDWTEQIHAEMAAVVGTYGINTFKHFMAYKGALMVDDDQMFASFRRCAQLGAMPLVHAENGDVVARLQEKYLADGITGPEGHAFSRPPAVEAEATNRAIMLADMASVPVYIVHVSCREAADAIARARAAGKRVYGEPLIQHLVLDESEYMDRDWLHAARRVMSPPFRDKAHQAALWTGLQSGALQIVATDHCAFSDAQRKLGLGDFTKIPNGTGGLEDRLKVLWTFGVATGRLTAEEFVAVTSANVARALNVFPRKGAVMPGADADLVIFDGSATSTISAKTQMSRTGYNVFEGTACTGAARITISRGVVAWEDGDFRAKTGDGDYVARPAFPAVAVADAQWRARHAPRAAERPSVTP